MPETVFQTSESIEDAAVRKRNAVHILGFIEIATGVGICILETTILILYHHSGAPGYPIQYAGIWTGIFAILAGIVQVLAGKKTISIRSRRSIFLGGLGTAIVCILQGLAMFALSMYNIYLVRREIAIKERPDYVKSPLSPESPLEVSSLKDLAMLDSIVALVYFCLVVFEFISAVLDCCNVCGKRKDLPPGQRVYASVDGTQVKQIKIYTKD